MGRGWLSEMGSSDFAGSTIELLPQEAGTALTGAILLGARKENLIVKVMLL